MADSISKGTGIAGEDATTTAAGTSVDTSATAKAESTAGGGKVGAAHAGAGVPLNDAPSVAVGSTGVVIDDSARPEPVEEHSCCLTGFLDVSAEPKGREEIIAGLPTYVALPLPGTGGAAPSAAVIIVPDIFGYSLRNSRIIADKFAERLGIPCYIPDLLEGDAVPAQPYEHMVDTPPTFGGKVWQGIRLMTSIPSLVVWSRRHPDSKVIPLLNQFIKELRENRGIRKLAVQGYCFGGRYAVLAGGGVTVSQVEAFAAAHPASIAVPADIDAVKVPGIFILAGKDWSFSKADVQKTKDILTAKVAAFPTEFHEYPGTSHGFAVRGNNEDEVVRTARQAAFEATATFFRKHLL